MARPTDPLHLIPIAKGNTNWFAATIMHFVQFETYKMPPELNFVQLTRIRMRIIRVERSYREAVNTLTVG